MIFNGQYFDSSAPFLKSTELKNSPTYTTNRLCERNISINSVNIDLSYHFRFFKSE